ncbi:hypothetical protein K438DRAFT_1969471 [Mycena galopus ATCC 62051]|nr:hypothetical protein K438DRAFT_1969471 [Mycena galopus ATCC 62051]
MGVFLLPFFPSPFAHSSFLLTLSTLLFHPFGVYTDVVLSHPVRTHPSVHRSLLPASPERCVQDAPRLPALPAPAPAFCSSTTSNSMRSATMKLLVTCLMRPTPMYDLTPDTVPCLHPQHPAPAHRRYTTQQALSFLDDPRCSEDLQQSHPLGVSARASALHS